jgi:hypothetical protein
MVSIASAGSRWNHLTDAKAQPLALRGFLRGQVAVGRHLVLEGVLLNGTRIAAGAARSLSVLADVVFELFGHDGSDVPWVPGEYHAVYRVDLSRILIKGTPGDLVTVIGGTW